MSIYQPLEHALGIPWVLQAAVLAAGLLLLAGWLIRRQIATAGGGLMPDEGLTLRNAAELIVEMLGSLGQQAIGPDHRKYLPLIATLFAFILISNLMGLIPGVGGGTSDVNVTAAWAVISVITYNVVGIHHHGLWKYSHQFMGPAMFELKLFGKHLHIRPLFWFFLPLEIFLHAARILTLALRLLANMFADHTVVAVFLTLVPIGVPAIFMGLGLMVAFLQAFVFSLLTMIYIGLALQEAH